jgi:hypothetical protein
MSNVNNHGDNGGGKTLWEIFKDRLHPGSAALSFYNPLDMRVDSAIALDKSHPEFAAVDFTVKEIREYTRRIQNQSFVFTDYVARGFNPRSAANEDPPLLRLRVVPNEAGTRDALLLQLYDEMAFDENFLAVVKDTTGITDDVSGETETYTRINDNKEPYAATVLVATATANDGQLPTDKAVTERVQYWDYWRDRRIGQGTTTQKQFVFVEMNTETGWIQIWRGTEYFL